MSGEGHTWQEQVSGQTVECPQALAFNTKSVPPAKVPLVVAAQPGSEAASGCSWEGQGGGF